MNTLTARRGLAVATLGTLGAVAMHRCFAPEPTPEPIEAPQNLSHVSFTSMNLTRIREVPYARTSAEVAMRSHLGPESETHEPESDRVYIVMSIAPEQISPQPPPPTFALPSLTQLLLLIVPRNRFNRRYSQRD